MIIIKANDNKFIDDKFGLIKKLYDLPSYSNLPRIYVKMAFGSSYATSGFNASGAGVTETQAKNAAIGEYIERYALLHPNFSKNLSKKRILPSDLNSSINDTAFDIKKMHWKDGINLLTHENVSIPYENIYLTYKAHKNNKNWFTTASGAACGENTNQIIWKCISEILERDAFVTNWRFMIPCLKIDISSNDKLYQFYKKYIYVSQLKTSLFKLDMDWSAPTVLGIAELSNGGCVVSASTRDTWIEACKKTLIELSQSLIGYASVLFNRKENRKITSYNQIHEYQDHSALYFNKNMARNLDFFNSGKNFKIPNTEPNRTDEEKVDFFFKQLKLIKRPVYYVDVTPADIIPFNHWHVGRVLIPNMLDVEPNYIPILKHNRLNEAKANMIKLGKKNINDFNNQPTVPHPFP